MNTIINAHGDFFNLGDEVYRVKHKGEMISDHYGVGTLVRPISGVDDNETPGYHFLSGYTTVCRFGTRYAEFVGFRNDDLEFVCTVHDRDLFLEAITLADLI